MRQMNGKDGNKIRKPGKTDVWDDMLPESEDSALFERIGEYMKGLLDILEVKNDPDYAETDEAVKLMITDYQNNTRNKENEKFIRENLTINMPGYGMNADIREIRQEISRTRMKEISSEWVREWHEKKQGNIKKDARIKEIREFITSSLEDNESRSGQQPDHREKRGLRRPLVIRYISLAAAVVTGVIFIVNALIPSDDPGRLFDKYYESLSAVSPVTRSLSGNETNSWTSAVSSYNNGDYEAALTGFSGLMSPDSSYVPPRFFLGMTHIALGNYNQAVSLLKGVAEKPGEYSKEAGWYLGLVYLKEGNKDKASECFEILAQSSGYYSERSEKILRRLR